MREPGFYWVKQYDKWIIAEYDKDRYENNYFWTTMYSDDYCFDDAEFQEIDERRIIREPQCKDAIVNLDGAKLLVFKDYAEYEKFIKEHEKHFIKFTD